jgi:hypothetical protein
MQRDDDAALTRVADAITDGTPVDWEAESSANQHLRTKLQNLRLIHEVAAAHRSLAATTPDEPAAATPVVPAPLATWGPLKILELLGSGGFGEVYRAYDPALQREVALKLRRTDRDPADPSGEAFLREARGLARVRHHNIVVVHGADRHDGRIGLWTDLLRGRTLEQIVADQGPFGPHEAALIGIDLCQALAKVHAAGLVHGDVKTSNVMREQGGRIVLMDFGSVGERPTGSAFTDSAPVSGTPLYTAPERILSGRPATTASDIYALGVVLFRLATGRLPIEAETWAELTEKHRAGQSIALRDLRADLPAPFVQVVERALHPDPQRRFTSAAAMERTLAAAAGLTITAEVPAQPTPIKDTSSSRRLWMRRIAWTAAMAAAITAGLLLYRQLQPGSLTAEATLYRQGQGTDERLLPGSRVHPGDRLFLEIQGQQRMHVYVLNEDEAGNAFVLFPAGLDLDNPLPPGVRHRLPGRQAARQMTWEVTSAGTRETFVVIASRRPLKALEREIALIPRVETGRQVAHAPVSPEGIERLRGIGRLAEATPPPEGALGGRVSEIADGLSARADRNSDFWIWKIQLENPGS